MNQLRPFLQFAALIVAPLAAAPGCTTMAALKRDLAEQPPRRQERKKEVVADFEARRDAARLQAALNRWSEGNEAACYQQLSNLVKSTPRYVDARLQFAELLLYRGDLDQAQKQLLSALELAPERADLHDCLGRVLEAASQHDQALVHFQRAAELDPSNELYRSPQVRAAASDKASIAASRAP